MSETEIFKNQFTLHLNKVLEHSVGSRQFIYDHIVPQLDSLTIVADAKIQQMLSDSEEHSAMVAMPPVCFDICVLPCSMDEATRHFEHSYGGFGQLVANIMFKHPAFTVQGCQILVCIIYGRYGTKCWANLAIHAPRYSDYPDATVIPIDLLTQEERLQAGF